MIIITLQVDRKSMNTFIFRRALFLLLSSILIVSCIRDLDESLDKINRVNRVTISPEFAAPLVSSRLTLADILKQTPTSFVKIDDQNLIHIVYRGELISLEAKDFASLSDQNFTGAISLNAVQIADLTANGSTQFSFSTIFNFGIPDMEIDSVLMKISTFLATLSTDLQHDVSIKLDLPGVKRNNVPLSETFDLPYGGENPLTKNIGLSKAFFDLTQSGDKDFSQLLALFEITVTEVAGNPVSATDEIRFEADFLYNEYEVMFGYLGEIDASPDEADTIDFSIFSNSNSTGTTTGTFTINDPKVTVIIGNSYGMPMLGKIKEFSTYSEKHGASVLTGYPDPLVIPVPNKNQIGETLTDSFYLDKSNSNLATLINNIPDKLVYSAGVVINPPGTTERNFITYNSKVTFTTDIDIPLYGSADGFVLEQDQPINLDFEDVEELESVTLKLYIENEFPVDVGMQIYFVDSMDNVLDSLIQPYQLFLESPAVDGNGRIIGHTSKTMDFVISRDRLENIRKTKIARIRSTLNTYKPGSGAQPEVKFYSDYGIFIKIGVQAKAMIDINITE